MDESNVIRVEVVLRRVSPPGATSAMGTHNTMEAFSMTKDGPVLHVATEEHGSWAVGTIEMTAAVTRAVEARATREKMEKGGTWRYGEERSALRRALEEHEDSPIDITWSVARRARVDPDMLRRIVTGKRMPTEREMIGLSVALDKSVKELFEAVQE